MTSALLDAVRRYAAAHADRQGVARTPIAGLTVLCATAPSQLQYAISSPLVAMVLQGSKRVTMGSETFDFGAGESLLIAADVPTASQITRATVAAPYFSLVLDLDRQIVEQLSVEMGAIAGDGRGPVSVQSTEADVAEAALRLMRLLERPGALPVLQQQLVREMHYWLLTGPHGGAIRELGVASSRGQRIARAVALIRAHYAEPLAVQRLADAAGMSSSSFHEHFRAVTSLTPLQFQKRMRLIEARRKMLDEGTSIANAAFAVGYESVPQFTREYARTFGLPPARDMKAANERMRALA
ncbi:AraC family transcriptional regulator N-terminal domain-containing protein [Paracidovorax citrulli]